MVNKKNNSKIQSKIEKEIKEDKKKRIEKKEASVKTFEKKEKKYSSIKKRNAIQITIIVIFMIILLILLCNRTFFRNEYRTSKLNLEIPMLMFYINDDGEELTMKTLRKSDYVKSFFDGELGTMTRYKCDGGYSFYYNNDSKAAIYSIDVIKKNVVKTVKIRYANGDADCLCNAGKILNAKEAEEKCSLE